MFVPSAQELNISRVNEIKKPEIKLMLALQHHVLLESRKILSDQGFFEFLAPIIGPATDPGIRGAGRVSFNYYGRQYKIMSSIILYKQALIRTLPKIYAFSPNVRLEPLSNTESTRHLCEFYQLDFEIRNSSTNDIITETEKFLSVLLSRIKDSCGEILEAVDRKLKVPSLPFKRVPYHKVIDFALSHGKEMTYGNEIPWEIEELLSQQFTEPFWITEYPDGSRGFYYKQDPSNPDILLSVDLIYPEGFGEAASGGEREINTKRIRALMKKTGENVREYFWYLKMLEEDANPSAGLGIGVERLTRYILGYKDISYCTAFPKKPGDYTI